MSNPIFQLWRAIRDFAWETGTMTVFWLSSHSSLTGLENGHCEDIHWLRFKVLMSGLGLGRIGEAQTRPEAQVPREDYGWGIMGSSSSRK